MPWQQIRPHEVSIRSEWGLISGLLAGWIAEFLWQAASIFMRIHSAGHAFSWKSTRRGKYFHENPLGGALVFMQIHLGGHGFSWKTNFSLKIIMFTKNQLFHSTTTFHRKVNFSHFFRAASDLFQKSTKLPTGNVVLEQHFQPGAEMERKSALFHKFPTF